MRDTMNSLAIVCIDRAYGNIVFVNSMDKIINIL